MLKYSNLIFDIFFAVESPSPTKHSRQVSITPTLRLRYAQFGRSTVWLETKLMLCCKSGDLFLYCARYHFVKEKRAEFLNRRSLVP
jgi:hypothetical protein